MSTIRPRALCSRPSTTPVGDFFMAGDSLYTVSGAIGYSADGKDRQFAIFDTRRLECVNTGFITDGTEKDITVPYGIAVNPVSKEIYITDARNYVNPGYLHCYSPGRCAQMVSADGRYSFEDCVLLMICLADSAEILLISCGVLCRKDKTMFLNRFFGRICAACVLVVVAAACDGGSDAVSDYGFDRAVYHPRHSGGFAVDGRSDGGASLMLTVHTPWQGADSVADARRLLLLARARTSPRDIQVRWSMVAHGALLRCRRHRLPCLPLPTAPGWQPMLSWDFRGCVIFPTIHCAAVSTIAPMLATKEMWIMKNSPRCLPTLFLLYGITSASAMESKLESLGIPYTYIGEHADSTPLGKAEWIVAAGYIAGRGTQAERAMSHIENRYESLVRHIRRYLDSTQTELPSVMINAPYSDLGIWPAAKATWRG